MRRSFFVTIGLGVLAAACSGRSNPAAPSQALDASRSAVTVQAAVGSAPAVVAWSCLTTPGCAVPSSGAGGARAVLALTAPGVPVNLAASVSGSTVTLTWAASTTAGPDATPSSYRLEAGASSGASDIANADTGSAATTYIATGVPNGTYYVRVRAANSVGRSGASSEVVVTVGSGGCAPAAPSGLRFFSALGKGSFALNWDAPTGGACTPRSARPTRSPSRGPPATGR